MKKWILITTVWVNALAHAQTNKTVFPPGLDAQAGNSGDSTFSGLVPSYQELFRASTLAAKWQSPVQITAVAFRVAENSSSSFDAVVPRVEIRLSTSLRSPELMSRFYSENKGADETTVFLHDSVRIFATGTQPVNPFEVHFQFDAPFTYDPANGHLLMYLANTAGAPGEQGLDAHSFGSLNSSTPFASFGGGGFLAPTGYGLVTEFSWFSIPEPTVIDLAGLGTAFLFLGSLIKRRA